jgi:hypothetical protein
MAIRRQQPIGVNRVHARQFRAQLELRPPAIGGSEWSAANGLAAEADFHPAVQRRMSSRYRTAAEFLPHFSDWRIRL